MRINDYRRVIRRYATALLLAALIGCAGGLGYSLAQSPTYTATAKVFISVQQAANLGDLSQGVGLAQTLVRSYSQAVPTQLVLDPVIESLDLKTTSADLAQRVEVDSPLDTTVLEISVTDPSPVQAARIANAVESRLAATIDVLTPPTADSAVPVKTTLMQSALAPAAPTTPNIRLNIALGVVGVVGITVLVLLVRSGLRRSIRSHEQELLDDDALVESDEAASSVVKGRRMRGVASPVSE